MKNQLLIEIAKDLNLSKKDALKALSLLFSTAPTLSFSRLI